MSKNKVESIKEKEAISFGCNICRNFK